MGTGFCSSSSSSSAEASMSILVLLLLLLHQFYLLGCNGQQTYVDNRQLDCEQNYTTTLGYVCNGATTSCPSYLTFRSQPPTYNTPAAIAALLLADAFEIARINDIPNVFTAVPATTPLIVPIANCSCSGALQQQQQRFYQHNASYVRNDTTQTYFSIANNTYEGLTTCQSLISQNPYNYRQLAVGANITIPLRCACPTPNQTAAGIKYLLTYLIAFGDSYSYISDAFGGVDLQSIYDANELSSGHIIFPFTPILVPLTTEPTKINISASPPPPPPSTPELFPSVPTGTGNSSRNWVYVGVGIGVGFLVLVALSGLLFWFFRRRGRKPTSLPTVTNKLPAADYATVPGNNSWSVSLEGVRYAIESLTLYKYEELEKATGFFGEGNRIKGSVYRGSFNGDDAAVKMMEGDVSGEINILKQINHSNIIRLSGFCLHQGNTYLVYEYAENGSLSDWLHSRPKMKEAVYSVLDWKQRVQVAYDIADALNYLHNFTSPPCIHKNLKSSNVLLDGHMRAKIANFGLARNLDENPDEGLQLTRHVVGTYGYMPPEYIENGLITPKLDVFALGVVILELLSGQEAARARNGDADEKNKGGDERREEDEDLQQLQLSAKIKEALGGDNVREKLVGFMDPRLRHEYPLDLAYSMTQLASNCVANDLNSRPSVADVFMTLSKILSSSLDWDPSDEIGHSRSLSRGR